MIEHGRERGLEFECLLDLVSANVWVLAIFEETRAMVIADKFNVRGWIGLPIFGKSFEVFEHRINPGRTKKRYCVLGVFVEVGIEDTLILEVGFSIDFE